MPSPIDIAAVQKAALVELPAADILQPVAAPLLRWSVVGRLSPEKGQRTAIEAHAQLCARRPQQFFELTLVGDGPDRQALLELAAQLGVQSSVRFVGYQSNPYAWMAASDLICIPSIYEGLPNVALEAMCLSIPLVASDCSGSLRELLGSQHSESDQLGSSNLSSRGMRVHERGVLTPVGDVAGLVAAVLDRIDRPAPWLSQATAARAWITTQHGIQPWLEHMQQLFEQRRVVDLSLIHI